MTDTRPYTLRLLAEQRGLLIGSAVNYHSLCGDGGYRETLAREFNLLTPENELKYGELVSDPGKYDFYPADEIVNFARANDMRVRGHTLVWHHQNPRWLDPANYTRSQALDLLQKHIFTVMGHFRGSIYAWDVVNEALEDDGTLRRSFWLKTTGPDYLDYAFRWAREADPKARLIYNEYRADGLNTKAEATYRLLKDLLARGTPVEGVGLQMHLALYPTDTFAMPPDVEEFRANLRRLSNLGLEIHITELDVQIQQVEGSREALLEKQAQVYGEIFATALENTNVKAIVTWGFSDRQSWIPYFTHAPDAPLLFDEYYQPKPAYQAVYQSLVREAK